MVEKQGIGIDSLQFNICLDDPRVPTRTSCGIILDPSTTQDPSILDDPALREYYSPGYLYRRGPNPNEVPVSSDTARLNQKYVRWVFGRYVNRARAEVCDSIAAIQYFGCVWTELVFTDSGVARQSDYAAIVTFNEPGYREIIMTVFSDADSVADTLVINISAPPTDSSLNQLRLDERSGRLPPSVPTSLRFAQIRRRTTF